MEGHVRAIVAMLERSTTWSDLLQALDVRLISFRDLGLAENADDRTVWRAVQAAGAMLITDNRNHDSSDSLQAAIETENAPDKIPVATIGNLKRFRRDRDYAERVA